MAFMLCGSSKHHHASMDSLALQESRQAFMALNNLPEVNQDVGGMDSFTVSLLKGKKGYGFTVVGSCPVKVGQVKDNSPAADAGLEKDDVLVKINGKNVSRSIADTVAKIIRNSDHEVILELYRPFESANKSDQCVPSSPAAGTHRQSPCRSQASPAQAQGIWSPYNPPQQFSPKSSSPNQMVPSNTPPSRSSKMSSSFNDSLPYQQYHIEAEVYEAQGACGGEVPHTSRAINLDEWQDDEPFQRTSTPTGLRTMSFLDLSGQEQKRQDAIADLRFTEQKFVVSMQFGIERYLQRLRYSVIDPEQHVILFQNIEKLVAMADFNTRLFHEQGVGFCEPQYQNQQFVDAVGTLYRRHIDMMCEAYESYCSGAKNAIRLLAELRRNEAFQTFLQDTPVKEGNQTLGTFLQTPIQHMKDLVVKLQAVYSNTPASHHDSQNLKQVIQALRRTCSVIYENSKRLCQSTFSLASTTSTLPDSPHRPRQPSPYTSRASPFNHRDSESVCSFQSKSGQSMASNHSGHSSGSRKSVHSHHSQDSGISVRKNAESEEETHNSNHSTESGFSGSFCDKCKDSKRSSSAVSQASSARTSDTLSQVQSCRSQMSTASSIHHPACPKVQSSEISSIHSDPPEVELSSIDSEVLDIQNRLLFGNGIRSFRIASSTRHMIYAGDLLYHTGDGWEQMYVVLLSDLLLITRVEADNYLTVVEEPIILLDVASASWNCPNEREFQVTASCMDCHHTDDFGCRTTFCFRAPSTELKHTWENIVDQRIVACKTQPERDMQFGKVIAEFI